MANKIIVHDTPITVIKQGTEDYICLTDMLHAKDGDFFVTDWLRNRNTLEYIGIWEKVYNPDFNYGEFATIRNQAGLNRLKIYATMPPSTSLSASPTLKISMQSSSVTASLSANV